MIRMPPNSPASENKPRRTLKNVRGTWLQKGKRHLVKQLRINPVTDERGNLFRNVAGLNAITKAGLRNSRKKSRNGFGVYTNRPRTLKGKLSRNDKRAIEYRQFNTSRLTPQNRGQTLLSPNEAKVAANVYAAAAPEYNYQEMVNTVFARTNLSPQQKDKIADNLYELYGPNNNNSAFSNNTNWEDGMVSPTGAVVNYVNEPVVPTVRKQETGKRASLPADW